MQSKSKKTKKVIKKRKKRLFQQLSRGRIYVSASFNNTIVTLTDLKGQTVLWGSCGSTGFKGARKSTPFAAATTANGVIKKARALGLRELEIYLKGPGPGRDSVVNAIKANRIKILMIADVTPIPHNGCRKKKRRRV